MSDITERIAEFRRILKEYDDGMSSAAMCLSEMHSLVMDPFLKSVETGDGYLTFGSCCCSGHPPDRIFTVRIHMQPHGFEAKRVGLVKIIPRPEG